MTANFVVSVLLASLLLPGPADFASIGGSSQRCARFCRDGGGKFAYLRGQRYVYDYRADTMSSVSGVGEEESRLHLSATVSVWPLSKCDFVMQLHNVLLEESSPGNISVRSPVQRMEDFSGHLEGAPLRFSFQDGRVEELCASDQDGRQPWVLNVKRGVLSAFQNSLDDFGQQGATVLLETDVTGTCDTEYSVSSTTGDYPVVVTKVKDLTSCDHRYTGSHSIPSVPYNRGLGMPFVRSEQKCEQKINGDNVLEKSICEEIHLFRPFSSAGNNNGVVTKVLQMLLLRKVTPMTDNWKPEGSFPTRTTMLYRQPSEETVPRDEEGRILELLKRLEGSTRHGTDAATPRIFSQLVVTLEATGYPQLAKVFGRVRNPAQRKFLLDAMPYVGTADGMTVVTDLFRSGEIKPEELDSWLTSLTFQKKPTLNMLAAVSPLMDSRPRQKAVLGITSMVRNYCQLDKNCLEKPRVRALVTKTEELLGKHCKVNSAHSEEDLVVALKGIGNLGLVTSGDILTKCCRIENPVEVRLAAIAATRMMPCSEAKQEEELLSTFSNASEDVEVRIAAYQSVMRCPSYDTLALVRSLLLKEEVNQVGSYVWTHLTNLRGTRSPWKQATRELLLDDFLQRKFSTDARQFSRNYELSTPLGAAEADVVFTPASFLPRSAALSLTVDLFGEPLSLLDLGARAEGFEGLLEDLLGNGSSKPSAAGSPRPWSAFLSELKSGKSLPREPRGSLSARVLGHEVSYRRFRGLPSLLLRSPSLALGGGGGGLRYNKTFSLVRAAFSVPTACGFPLELSVNGSAAVRLEAGVRVEALTAEARLAPSAAVEVAGSVAVDAFVARAGVVGAFRLGTNTYLEGALRLEAGGRLAEVRVGVPRKRAEVVEAEARLFLLHRGVQRPVEEEGGQRTKGCSSEGLSRALGVQLCGEVAVPRAFPLGGPALLKVVLFKTDTFDSYQFRYSLRNDRHSKQLLVAFDTPGSSVDRKFRASLDYDAKKASLEADVRSPAFRVSARGKVSDGTVTATVTLDGEELLALNAGVSSSDGHHHHRRQARTLEPRVYLAVRKTHVLLDAVARVLYVEGTRYKATLEVNGLLGATRKVLDVSADLTMDRRAVTVSGAFESQKLSGTFEGAYRSDRESVNSHARVEYSGKDDGDGDGRWSKVLEMAAKLRNVKNADSVARSLQFHVQLPDLEDYNTKVRWQLEYGERLFHHHALVTVGKASWETEQQFRCRTSAEGHVDFRLMAALLGTSHGVDYKFDTKLRTADSGVETYLTAHRNSLRKYTALLRYRNLEELRVIVALPDLEFHLDSALGHHRQETGESFTTTLRADANVTYVTLAGLRRTRRVGLLGDYYSTNKGKDHEVRVSLDGIVAGNLVAALRVAADGAATQTLVVEASGRRYAQTLVYRYDRGHLLSVTVETPPKKYTGDISATWTEEEKSLFVDLQLSKPFTFNTKVLSTDAEDSAELELLWDSAPTFSVRMRSAESEHGLLARYLERHLNATVSTPPKGVSARVSWGDADAEDAVSLDADWERLDGLTAVLRTPFEGLEAQELSYSYRRRDDDDEDGAAASALEVALRWHEGRDSASLRAESSASGSADGRRAEASVAFRSSLASLDDVSLRVTHRRSPTDGSDGAELTLNGRRFTADARWRADARRGVALNASLGDAAAPDARHRASLEYAGLRGRLELHRGAERLFLWAHSLAAGAVEAALRTPAPWLRRAEAHARWDWRRDGGGDGEELEASAGAAFNDHEANVDVAAQDDARRLYVTARFKSTLTDAATLTLVHGKTPGAALEDLRVTRAGVPVATLSLRAEAAPTAAAARKLDATAEVPALGVAAQLLAEDGRARVAVRWNADSASLELEGRPGHYEAALASSRLPRGELRAVLDQRRDAEGGCETRASLTGGYEVRHEGKVDAGGWRHKVSVETPEGVASVSDEHEEEPGRLRHRLEVDVHGEKATLGVQVDRDAWGSVSLATADVATPWSDPASLSLVRSVGAGSATLEVELRYRGDGRAKVTCVATPWEALTVRLEAAPRLPRPVQLTALATGEDASLRLEWEGGKTLEALASARPDGYSLSVARADGAHREELASARVAYGEEPGRLEAALRCPWLEAEANATEGKGVSFAARSVAAALGLRGSWSVEEDVSALELELSRGGGRYAATSRFLWAPGVRDVHVGVGTDTDAFRNVTLGAGWSLSSSEYRAGAYLLSAGDADDAEWRLNGTWTAGTASATLKTPLPDFGAAAATLSYDGDREVRCSVVAGDAWRLQLLANRTSDGAALRVDVCEHRLTTAASFRPGGARVALSLDGRSLDASVSVDDRAAEAEVRTSASPDPVRVRAAVGDGSFGVAVTSGRASVLDFRVHHRDDDAGLRLVAPAAALDVGVALSLKAATPGLAMHLATRGGLNNTVSVAADAGVPATASVAALASLPSWGLPRYSLDARYDAAALPKALRFRLTGDAATLLALDFATKRNSVNAFLTSDALDWLGWTLRGTFDLDAPRKRLDLTLDGRRGGRLLEARASFTELSAELELELPSVKAHALYDAGRSDAKTAKLVLAADGANLDLSLAGNLEKLSGFAAVNVTGTGLDLLRLTASYDLQGKVAASVGLVRNSRDNQVTGRFLADASRLLLLVETPSPQLRTLNVSSDFAGLDVSYRGLGAAATPARLSARWDADAGVVNVSAADVGAVESLEAYARLGGDGDAGRPPLVLQLSVATPRRRPALVAKVGVDEGEKVAVAHLLVADLLNLSVSRYAERPLWEVWASVKDVFAWRSIFDLEGLGASVEVDTPDARVTADTLVRWPSLVKAWARWFSVAEGLRDARILYDARGTETRMEAALTAPPEGRRLAVRWRRDGYRGVSAALETPFEGLRKLELEGAFAGDAGNASASLDGVDFSLGYAWTPQLKDVAVSLAEWKARGRLDVAAGEGRANGSLDVATPSGWPPVRAAVQLDLAHWKDALVTLDVDHVPKLRVQYNQQLGTSDAASAQLFLDAPPLSVDASAVASAAQGAASLSLRSPSLRRPRSWSASWHAGRREAEVLVDGERTLHLTPRAAAFAVGGVAGSLRWDVAEDAVDASLELRGKAEEEEDRRLLLLARGGVRRKAPASLAVSFLLTSDDAFRGLSLTGEVAAAPDLGARATVRWDGDAAPALDLSASLARSGRKMASSLRLGGVLLGASYDLDAPTKVVALKMAAGGRHHFRLRGRYRRGAEADALLVLSGREYLASARYDVGDLRADAGVSFKLGDGVLNVVNASLTAASRWREGSLLVDAAVPGVWAETPRWALEASYDADGGDGDGLGVKGEVRRDGRRHLAATLKVLPRFVWLEVRTPFSGFQNLTAETVLLGGDSVKVARVTALWGDAQSLELRLSSQVLEEGSVDVDVRLASPWTGHVAILGTYSREDDHVVRLRVSRGEEGEEDSAVQLVDGTLVLHVQRNKFSVEMTCTVEDLGSTALDVGYDISETSKKVYFNGSLDRLTLVALAEGSLSDAHLGGRLSLETPFPPLWRLEGLLDASLDAATPSASLLVRRNADEYEASFSGRTTASSAFEGLLSLCAAPGGLCLRNVSLAGELSEGRARLHVSHRGREAELLGLGGGGGGVTVLSARAKGFGQPLEDASASLRVDRRGGEGALAVVWSPRGRGVRVRARLLPGDLEVAVSTPSDQLGVAWRLQQDGGGAAALNGSVQLNGRRAALGVALRIGVPGEQVVEGQVLLDGERLASLSAQLLSTPASLRGAVSLTTPFAGLRNLSADASLRWRRHDDDDAAGVSFRLLSPTPYLTLFSAHLDPDGGGVDVRTVLQDLWWCNLTVKPWLLVLRSSDADAYASLSEKDVVVAGSVLGGHKVELSYHLSDDEVVATVDVDVPLLGLPRCRGNFSYHPSEGGNLHCKVGGAEGTLAANFTRSGGNVTASLFGLLPVSVSAELSFDADADATAAHCHVDVDGRRRLLLDMSGTQGGVQTLRALVDSEATGRHDAELRFSDDVVKLRVDASLEALLRARPDAGTLVVELAGETHSAAYTVTEDSVSCELLSPSREARLRLQRRGAVDVAVLADGRVALALSAAGGAEEDGGEVFGSASLEAWGSRSGASFRLRRRPSFSAEVNVTDVLRALVAADEGSVRVSVAGRGGEQLLEAKLLRESGGFQLAIKAAPARLEVEALVDAASLEARLDAGDAVSLGVVVSASSLTSHLRLPTLQWRCDVPFSLLGDAARLNVTLARGGVSRGVHFSLDREGRLSAVAAGVRWAGSDADALLEVDLARKTLEARLATPFEGYERLAVRVEPSADTGGVAALSYVEWGGGRRVQVSHSTAFARDRLLLDLRVATPFKDMDRYALRLEYENAARKALVALASLPGEPPAGLEVSWLVKGPQDLEARLGLSLPFLPRAGLSLRHRVTGDALSSHAALDVASRSLALEVDSSRGYGRLRGRLDDAEVLCVANSTRRWRWLRLETPLEAARNLSVGVAPDFPWLLGVHLSSDAREVLHAEVAPLAVSGYHRSPPLLELRSAWLSAFFRLAGGALDARAGWRDTHRWAVAYDGVAALEAAARTPGRDVRLVARAGDAERVLLLSPAPGLAVGVAARRNATHSFARLDLLARAVEALWTRGEEGQDVQLFWDADRDRTRRAAVRVGHRRRDGGVTTLALQSWPVTEEVVVQLRADSEDSEGRYLRLMKVDVTYGPLEEQRFTAGFDVEVLRAERLLVRGGFVLSHPRDLVHLEARLSAAALAAANLTVAFADASTGALRSLGASYRLDGPRGAALLALETPENLLELSGRLRALPDGLRTLELSARPGAAATPTLLTAELHPARLHARLTVRRDARGATLFLEAAPRWRRVAAGVAALGDPRGGEASAVAALNTTRLLWTRAVLRPGALRFLGAELLRDVEDATRAAEEAALEATDLLRADVVGRLALAGPRLRGAFRGAVGAAGRELGAVGRDLRRLRERLELSYHADEFYVRTLVEASLSALSAARETLSVIREEFQEMWATVKTSAEKLFDLLVRGIALDEVVSRLEEWFQAFQEIASMAADNAIKLAEEMCQLQVRTRESVRAAVKTVREQLLVLKKNSEGSLRDLEMEVRTLVGGVLRVLEPLISQVQEYVANVRRASQAVSDKLNELVSQIGSALLDVKEITYLVESYTELKAWVSEINVKELADLVVKIVADSVESIVRDVMQTVDNLVVFVGGVRNATPLQATSVKYVRETVNTIYQKVTWLWERYNVNGFLVDTVKVLLEELDGILAELSGVLEGGDAGGLADVLGARVKLRPDAGVLEYTQRLPVEWKAFNQLPNLDELELQRKPVVARLKDNIESYVMSSYKELTKNRTWAELLPPFPKQAVMVRGRHFVTFDGRYHSLPPEADGQYLLAADFLDDKFSAYVSVVGQRARLTLVSEGLALRVGPAPSFPLLDADGRPLEFPHRGGAQAFRTPSGGVRLEAGGVFSADCDAEGAVCVFQLSGWLFGRSWGLLGTPDNEPSDDLPGGADAWRLPGPADDDAAEAPPVSADAEAPAVPASLCAEYFSRQSSPLSQCFGAVDPAPFRRLCEELAVCDAAGAYVGVCRKKGVALEPPGDCVRCESRDGFPLKAGATQSHVGDQPPSSADLVVLLLATTCGDHAAKVADLVAKLDSVLGSRNVSSRRYALVGPDGAARTAHGGGLWFDAGSFPEAWNSSSPDASTAAPLSDALALASSVVFRDGAAKVVLDAGCHAGAAPFQQAREDLQRRGVALVRFDDRSSVDEVAESVATPPGCQLCRCLADGGDGVGRLECEACGEEPEIPEDFFLGDDYYYCDYDYDDARRTSSL